MAAYRRGETEGRKEGRGKGWTESRNCRTADYTRDKSAVAEAARAGKGKEGSSTKTAAARISFEVVKLCAASDHEFRRERQLLCCDTDYLPGDRETYALALAIKGEIDHDCRQLCVLPPSP